MGTSRGSLWRLLCAVAAIVSGAIAAIAGAALHAGLCLAAVLAAALFLGVCLRGPRL